MAARYSSMTSRDSMSITSCLYKSDEGFPSTRLQRSVPVMQLQWPGARSTTVFAISPVVVRHMHMHVISEKKLRLIRQPGEVGKGSKEARPSPIRQTGPHSHLGALPSRACLAQLGRPGPGQADELLAPVLPGADGDPAGV